ncbi:MAG TPA: hypothetical protein VF602_04955 [Pedobacter sp.]
MENQRHTFVVWCSPAGLYKSSCKAQAERFIAGFSIPSGLGVSGMGFVGELISNRWWMQEGKAMREAGKMVYPDGFEILVLN